MNITNHNTIKSRHGPHAIRRIALQSQHACGLGTDEQNMLQTLREAPALKHFNLETVMTSQRDEPEMTSSRASPKKGVGWTHHWRLDWKTIQHEENEERQKHEQTVILKSNSGWKTFWRTTTMRERKPPGNKTGKTLPHHFTKKTANNNAQTLHATHSDQPCKMILPSQHPHRRRNMCFLMCPCMTWNTVPLGGHAHSHKIQLTAPPSQHLIEQTRTTTGRRSVALGTLTLRRLHREKKQRGSCHVALHKKCWMNWPLTHGVERTSTKRQRARNMISS